MKITLTFNKTEAMALVTVLSGFEIDAKLSYDMRDKVKAALDEAKRSAPEPGQKQQEAGTSKQAPRHISRP
jgi:hypothetical protein